MTGHEISLRWETWKDFGHDALAIAGGHFAEVEGDLAEKRPYKPDSRTMGILNENGILHCLAARSSVEMVGYFTWNILPDIESLDLIIGMQGAWYISPPHRRGTLGVRMFDESVRYLRSLGVSNAFLHHRANGAGKGIGRFFSRRGAVMTQTTYSLWIGE